ncbi:MAG: trehalase family glycosidase, partial [Klebsiella sp.]|nr:trehalase family glycosidase [Klebsiella sp.]
MFSQKLRHVEDDELRIDIDPCYEADPYELKLDEMIDAEPEPEVIEGLPASDALAPKHDPLDILRNYRKVKRQPDFDLRQFVEDNFWLPENQTDVYTSDPSLTLKEHIDKLWPVLTREPQDHIPWSSLLALPQAYIVPGGRFSETYYWDSYFTMLGLAESGREDLLKCMADNFAWLIETYGHIPNGNRTYYLSRSQPPVFALMVELFEEDGVRGAKRYLDHLKMEHAFWMDGAPANEVYRDLRAGAASGWDYSSRWLRDITRLASIRTTQFIPIDLNAFLFKLETTIANLSGLKGDRETEAAFRQKAQDRRAAVNRYLWDDENGCFRDYDWRREQLALFSA